MNARDRQAEREARLQKRKQVVAEMLAKKQAEIDHSNKAIQKRIAVPRFRNSEARANNTVASGCGCTRSRG